MTLGNIGLGPPRFVALLNLLQLPVSLLSPLVPSMRQDGVSCVPWIRFDELAGIGIEQAHYWRCKVNSQKLNICTARRTTLDTGYLGIFRGRSDDEERMLGYWW